MVLVIGALGVLTAPVAVAATGSSASLNVVAMGDSYGIRHRCRGLPARTEGTCYRSGNSYSSVIVDTLRQSGKQVKFTNVTCSGAAIRTLGQTFKDQPPQLDALRRDTDVVMLSIGTTDVDFAGYGGVCIQADCTGAPTKAVLSRLPGMGKALSSLLTDIKARSPYAKIVMTGYGRQVTRGENAPDVPLDPICDSQVFSDEERVEGNNVSSALDVTLRLAALAAKAHRVDVQFVSPYTNSVDLQPEFAGHSLCESAPQFYRGFDVSRPGRRARTPYCTSTSLDRPPWPTSSSARCPSSPARPSPNPSPRRRGGRRRGPAGRSGPGC